MEKSVSPKLPLTVHRAAVDEVYEFTEDEMLFVCLLRRLPRQCAHWLAMTWFFDSLLPVGADDTSARSTVPIVGLTAVSRRMTGEPCPFRSVPVAPYFVRKILL